MLVMSAIIRVIIVACIMFLVGCSGNIPNELADPINKMGSEDVEYLKLMIEEQENKISYIERELEKYQVIIDDQSSILEIYEDNNQNLIDFRRTLEMEVQTALQELREGSFEKEMTNAMIKVQNKIHILEDRTFYTDSLYFEIVNEMVLIENEITSLIASFQEMSEISGKKKTRVVPKITNEEYQAKYIESLSNYQNGEWNTSLDGFKFLIQSDSNHELADNSQYWIGEVYYSLKDFRRSIKEFEKVFTFAGTNKADDAQFKLGLCYINIGELDKAKIEFENLLELYPNSEYFSRSQELFKQY
ncbi:MAG: tetratricopeptide repeat protein [Flavobacteriaceae bacterium TMED238]|nr:MAG: tetratricopeptide repeat protein [Flavobacteriaceae bacterium TMED238]